jgi:hypothetical protein
MILINALSPKMKDITGTTIGSLTAIRPLYKRNKNAATTWEWKCICGNTCKSEYATLIGNSKVSNNPKIPSCGCIKIESAIQTHTTHGLSKKGNTHPLFRAYVHMIDRCTNPKHKEYHHYGAKGVSVCEEWLKDINNFYNWSINNGWKPGLSLDKDELSKKFGINPPIYSPNTCQWVEKSYNCVTSGTRDNYGKNKKIKLSNADCKNIQLLRNLGKPVKDIAQQYQVHICTIYSILKLGECNEER